MNRISFFFAGVLYSKWLVLDSRTFRGFSQHSDPSGSKRIQAFHVLIHFELQKGSCTVLGSLRDNAWTTPFKPEQSLARKTIVNRPGLKAGVCDFPEVRATATAVSFLRMGSHRRGLTTLSRSRVCRDHLSPGTQFPGDAGSWHQSGHRGIGSGIVGTRSGAGPYRDCLGPHARTWDRFARYSGHPPPPCGLAAKQPYTRSPAGDGKTPMTRTCSNPVAGLVPRLPVSPSDPSARTAS